MLFVAALFIRTNFFTSRNSSLSLLLAAGLAIMLTQGRAASAQDNGAASVAGEVAHLQQMGILFPDTSQGTQTTPQVIPQLATQSDPTGMIATFQPNGATLTFSNPFFQPLGTNGRTCYSCHQPEDGWGLSARDARARFAADPSDPLFRLVDGATCPSDDVSSPEAMRTAYSLLVSKGLIRIALPMFSTMQFEIVDVDDPYGCNTSPITGLTGPQSGFVSFYRRPLPATNLGFLSTVMWDGREPNVFHQASDAIQGHEQAGSAPTSAQLAEIVTFEGCDRADSPGPCAAIPQGSGTFTAQSFDTLARDLSAEGASGGPVPLATAVGNFFIGINDPFGFNPTGAPFDPVIFQTYSAWDTLPGTDGTDSARAAIARGEQIFNGTQFNITDVAGLNDVLNKTTIVGTCGTCHDTPNVGDHSVKAPLNIGVANAGTLRPPVLDISGLPVFTVLCTAGALAGQTFQVTDLGRAMISGNCADLGKVKGPILRGLAARAPYFHNGSAATLQDVVDFYDQRFDIGLTTQQKSDLVAFLNSL